MQIFVSGSLAYDRIMSFPGKFSDHILPDKIHILNVCFLADGLDERFGGTAGNIAYCLALLGEVPTILSQLGKDHANYLKRLENLELPTEGIRIIDEEFTAGAYITTDQSDNQITCFNPGAMRQPSNISLDGATPEDTIAILGPGNVDDMMTYIRAYKEKGIRYIFDPGQQIPVIAPEQMMEAITGSWILISNDYELEMIMKATGFSREDILERTGHLITTLGENGSAIAVNGEDLKVPAAKAKTVADPTGAGDAFRAGLIKGICMGLDMETAAKVGAVSAVYCVEVLGTQEHSYTPEEFWQRFEENFGPLPQ